MLATRALFHLVDQCQGRSEIAENIRSSLDATRNARELDPLIQQILDN